MDLARVGPQPESLTLVFQGRTWSERDRNVLDRLAMGQGHDLFASREIPDAREIPCRAHVLPADVHQPRIVPRGDFPRGILDKRWSSVGVGRIWVVG